MGVEGGGGAVLAYLHDVHMMMMMHMQLLVYLYKGLCNNLRIGWVVECSAASTSNWAFFTGLVAITVHTTKLCEIHLHAAQISCISMPSTETQAFANIL